MSECAAKPPFKVESRRVVAAAAPIVGDLLQGELREKLALRDCELRVAFADEQIALRFESN